MSYKISDAALDEVISDLVHHSFSENERKRLRAFLGAYLGLSHTAGAPDRGIDENELKEAMGRLHGAAILEGSPKAVEEKIEILLDLLKRKFHHGWLG